MAWEGTLKDWKDYLSDWRGVLFDIFMWLMAFESFSAPIEVIVTLFIMFVPEKREEVETRIHEIGDLAERRQIVYSRSSGLEYLEDMEGMEGMEEDLYTDDEYL
ncbi:uncharacterized protein BJX67DRAFT_381982 [Aspergillus lucknowensis]|uniref:Uncharacterized protein n=1 Tax=Aspergillus lucknowensis TaxID=176173 RepID=A0ABR4LPK7_9EURO